MAYGLKHEIIRWKNAAVDLVDWTLHYKSSPLRNKVFTFDQNTYTYCIHPHNQTWRNERAVEIPIFKTLIDQYSAKDVLEVGNVLSYYGFMRHDVVDKYEFTLFQRVIREDFLSFQTEKKYSLIISISTIEHIGWDEVPRTPEKVLQVLPRFDTLLKVNGKAVVSIPLGQNQFLNEALQDGSFPLSQSYFLRRLSVDNQWEATDAQTAFRCKYGDPYPNANALLIGIYQPSKSVGPSVT